MADQSKMKGTLEAGTAMVITLLIMLVMTLIGLASLMTSSLDLRISGNERVQKQAFYAADAGLGFVRASPPLAWTSIDYTNPGPFAFQSPEGSSTRFNGTVRWIGSTTYPIRGGGSGGRGGMGSHLYELRSTGYAFNQAQKTLEMRGYRNSYAGN